MNPDLEGKLIEVIMLPEENENSDYFINDSEFAYNLEKDLTTL
jgi:hypothetical protein